MTEIRFSPDALSDLEEIRTYVQEECGSARAAGKILAKILSEIKKLSVFPQSGTPLASVVGFATNYRFLTCGSYTAFYRYENDVVLIVRVLHGRRNFMQILFGGSAL